MNTSSSSSLYSRGPTSPVQGAKLPIDQRIPVRPATEPAVSKSPSPASKLYSLGKSTTYSLPAYDPSSSHSISPRSPPAVYIPSSTPSSRSMSSNRQGGPVAESMIRDFRYNPRDKTPPKRKLAVFAEAIKDAIAEGVVPPPRSASCPQIPSESGSRQRLPQDLSPRLHTARLALIKEMSGPGSSSVQGPAKKGGRSTEYSRSAPATPEPHSASQPASVLADAQASKAALDAALERDRRIDDDETASIRKLPYAKVKDIDPLMVESRLDRADLEARLKNLGSAYRRLSLVVDHADYADLEGGDSKSIVKTPSRNEPRGQSAQEPKSLRTARSAPQMAPNPEGGAIGFLPSIPSIQNKGTASAAFFQSLAEPSMTATETSIKLAKQLTLGSIPAPPPSDPATTQEKSTMSSSSRCWKPKWRFIAIIITIMVSFGIIACSLSNLAGTPTYTSTPNTLIPWSKTITSEDGSSNLTISWDNGRAVSFNATYLLNATLTASTGEPAPDAYSFLLRWGQEGVEFGPDEEGHTVRTIPVPSFKEQFGQSITLLCVTGLLYLGTKRLLGWVSRRWHARENEGVFWTSKWLKRFDKGRTGVAYVVAAVFGALIWAALTNALLGG